MTYGEPARTPSGPIRARRLLVAVLLVVIAALAAALAGRLPASSSSTAAPPIDVLRGDRPRAPGEAREEHRRALGEADGAVPDGTGIFDDGVPGVANLEPALLDALRRAAGDAGDDGVELFVDSGWRSRQYQARLFRDAVAKYGSEAEAARWVATPDTSAHVSGEAVDVRPSDATAWLSENGAKYGLCQIYSNEPWHYELRADAAARGCPAMHADAAHGPSTQR